MIFNISFIIFFNQEFFTVEIYRLSFFIYTMFIQSYKNPQKTVAPNLNIIEN